MAPRRLKERDLPSEIEELSIDAGEVWLPQLLNTAGMVSSNSEGKRMIQQGSVRVNGEKVTEENYTLQNDDVLQVGKRKYRRIRLG